MSIDLTAKEGPLKGERFDVGDEGELLIGRTARGVNLPDPEVSLHHARIQATRRGFTLTDLDSATGTLLNGQRLTANKPAFIDVGDVIVIGISTFHVNSARERNIKRILFAMVPAWGLVAAAAGVVFWATGERPATFRLSSAIRTVEGSVEQVTFPHVFLREHGIPRRGLGLRQVTDLDGDGIDEIWLRVNGREKVVTTTAEGWSLVADLPLQCSSTEEGQGDLVCGDTLYRRMEGVYRPILQDRPVVWLQGPVELPPPPKDGPAPPLAQGVGDLQQGRLVPFRTGLGEADRAAGFLAERGVTSPVHYLLCEDAIPGLPAQVLLESGEARPLGFRCGDGLQLKGSKAEGYAGARVAAVALTAVGHARLSEHVAYALSGFEGDLFLDGAQQRVFTDLIRPPLDSGGGLTLDWRSTPHVFDPIPRSSALAQRVGLLTDTPRPPDVLSARVLESGDALLDVPGCSRLQIHAASFHCATLRGCLPGYSFVRVRDIGCGAYTDILGTGWGNGIWSGRTENVEVRVKVESTGAFGVKDAHRVRVGARPIGG